MALVAPKLTPSPVTRTLAFFSEKNCHDEVFLVNVQPFSSIFFCVKILSKVFVQLQWISEKKLALCWGKRQYASQSMTEANMYAKHGSFPQLITFYSCQKTDLLSKNKFYKNNVEKSSCLSLIWERTMLRKLQIPSKMLFEHAGSKKNQSQYEKEKKHKPALSNKSEKKERMIKNREMWKCDHSKRTFGTRLEI